MNFVDRMLVTLADPTTRANLFDQLALEQLTQAAYLTEELTLQGPFNPLFDEIRLGFGIPKNSVVEGYWSGAGGASRIEARFEMASNNANAAVRVDALWRGAIVARTASTSGRISAIETEWPTTEGIDDEIIAVLGALPANPVTLESERRTRYRQRLRAMLSQPNALDDAALDRWLRYAGASSVGDLITHQRGTTQFGGAQVTYMEIAAPPPSITQLSVSVALLIRDVGVSLADLLSDSMEVRQHLEPSVGRTESGSARLRQPLVIGWILPQAVFQDADWPTETNPANPADQLRERRTLAGRWLAREGIGLIVN